MDQTADSGRKGPTFSRAASTTGGCARSAAQLTSLADVVGWRKQAPGRLPAVQSGGGGEGSWLVSGCGGPVDNEGPGG